MIPKRPLYQSDESYHQTLDELVRRAQAGIEVKALDDTTIGYKNTSCNLGLCDDDIRETQDGIYREKRHVCPQDARFFEADGTPVDIPPSGLDAVQGCFYSCRVFSATRDHPHGDPAARILKAVGSIRGRS